MVLPITDQRWDIKPLDVGGTILAISVDHIVYSTLVIADPASYVYDLFAYKGFIGHLGNEVPSISQEDNHIIKARDFADKFVFLQTCADETALTIYKMCIRDRPDTIPNRASYESTKLVCNYLGVPYLYCQKMVAKLEQR